MLKSTLSNDVGWYDDNAASYFHVLEGFVIFAKKDADYVHFLNYLSETLQHIKRLTNNRVRY